MQGSKTHFVQLRLRQTILTSGKGPKGVIHRSKVILDRVAHLCVCVFCFSCWCAPHFKGNCRFWSGRFGQSKPCNFFHVAPISSSPKETFDSRMICRHYVICAEQTKKKVPHPKQLIAVQQGTYFISSRGTVYILPVKALYTLLIGCFSNSSVEDYWLKPELSVCKST